MEATDGIGLLTHTAGMDEEYRDTGLLQLRLDIARLRRLSTCLTAGLLFLSAALLASLCAIMLGARGPHSADSKPMMQPCDRSTNINAQQQEQDFKRPSAMLTAPRGDNSNGEYLEWESKDGNARCHGGFNYSGGALVVPRKGIYRVFLQITFESQKGACLPNTQIKLSIIVHYYRNSYPANVAILSSVDTVMCTEEPWSKSLYTAGLFSLDANSLLRVKSQPELIAKNEQLVFFGAELVSK